ncbi:MAG: sugar ABC transporter permease [Anaerolineales bacterium]|nr:sugar ABC transporter permease [Anaerolineales bacterium]
MSALQFDQPKPSTATKSADARWMRWAVYFYSILFASLGILAIVWLLMAIIRDPIIRMALEQTPVANGAPPSLIIAYLTRFGIVLPALILFLGALLIRLGFWLRTRSIAAARWAESVLVWMIVGGAFGVLFKVINLAIALSQPDTSLHPDEIVQLIALLAAISLFAASLSWLNRNADRVYRGQERNTSRETRAAWTFLLLTLTVFVMVAARPLEQTFIRSLTDKRFAGQVAPKFVGLENYQKLLGLRFDIVPCQWNEDTRACVTSRDGSLRWEPIERELMQVGYRNVWNFGLPFCDKPCALAISGLDQDFLKSIGTTLVFTIISVSIELVIALFFALTVNSAFWGRGAMRAVMLIPWAIPTVISARVWALILKDTSAGILNRVLMDLGVIGLPQAWLSVAALQIPAAIMVDVWKTTPFMALLLLAGLQTISKDLYEASSVDGATTIQQFFKITLPLMRPTIAVALVFRTLDSLRVFDLFNVLFGRQQLSMATYNYEMLVNNQQDGYASAISMIIFLLISAFAVLYVRLLKVETE